MDIAALVLVIISVGLVLATFILLIVCLVLALKKPDADFVYSSKTVWILLIIFLSPITPIIYLCLEHKKKPSDKDEPKNDGFIQTLN